MSNFNTDNMIKINVDPSHIIEVLNKMNQKIKDQDNLINNLQLQLLEFVKKSQYDIDIINLTKVSNDSLNLSKDLKNELILFKTQVSDSFKDTEENLQIKTNEVLLTINTNYKSSFDLVHTQLEDTHNEIKTINSTSKENSIILKQQSEIMKDITSNNKILGERIHHVNTELIKFVNKNNNEKQQNIIKNESIPNNINVDIIREEITNLSNRINKIEQRQKQNIETEIENSQRLQRLIDTNTSLLNERVTSIQKSMEISLSKPLPQPMRTENVTSNTALTELWNVTNQNRATLLNTITEHNLLNRRVEDLQSQIKILENKPIPIQQQQPIIQQIITQQSNLPLDNDILIKEQQQLESTVNGLADAVSSSIQDINRIKSIVNKNEKDIREVVMAFMDEFKLIRTNATGLEHLPPLNLNTCVPSFFNNPSYTFEREPSSCSTPFESERENDSTRNNEISRFSEIQFRRSTSEEENFPPPPNKTKRFSGLLHLISRPDIIKRTPKKLNKDNIISKLDKVETIPEIPEEKPNKIEKIIENNNIIKEKIIVSVDKESINELKDLFNKFQLEKNDLILSIDRKVDREMVERLFDKFRMIINHLNEKVKDISNLMNNFITQEDFEKVIEFIKHLPEINEKTLGIKKGPECLFCGRTKHLINQISSPRTLLKNNIDTTNILYGEGNTFIGSNNFDSFPNFPLPPLKK